LENDVFAGGIGERVNRGSRLCRFGVSMNTHTTEIMAEARLEECARGRVKRLTIQPQDIVNN
jgi:hypothetical protein